MCSKQVSRTKLRDGNSLSMILVSRRWTVRAQTKCIWSLWETVYIDSPNVLHLIVRRSTTEAYDDLWKLVSVRPRTGRRLHGWSRKAGASFIVVIGPLCGQKYGNTRVCEQVDAADRKSEWQFNKLRGRCEIDDDRLLRADPVVCSSRGLLQR